MKVSYISSMNLVDSKIDYSCVNMTKTVLESKLLMKLYGKQVEPIKITFKPIISEYEIFNPKGFIIHYTN